MVFLTAMMMLDLMSCIILEIRMAICLATTVQKVMMETSSLREMLI